jgi:dihydrolipoamide dehydrogenase
VIERADLIVVGSGQGGVPLAADFARAGKRVVLFERGAYGGSCINYGCTPSKSLLAAAHNAGRARHAAPLGVRAEVHVDQRAVFERLRRIRNEWSARVEKRLRDAGVELIGAQASFSGERTVRGGQREIQAPIVAIDTGTTAAIPKVPGLEAVPYLTNQTFFDLSVLPERLIVIGGGYIGLELGQGAQRLGSAVTIVHAHDRIMEREEADVSAALLASLQADGVTIRLSARPTQASYAGDVVRLTLEGGAVIEGDGLLIATGRIPNTQALGLERSSIRCARGGYVAVDDYLQTTCPGVYALGDVAGQPAFTHVSWEDYRRVTSTLAGKPRRRDDRVLAYATYTEPQVGRVGHTLESATAAGIDARAVTLPLSAVARAVEWNVEAGFFRLVVDRSNDAIVGATFVGYEAGELIHVILAHIMNRATWQVLDESVHIHPTLSEGLPTLARMFAEPE